MYEEVHCIVKSEYYYYEYVYLMIRNSIRLSRYYFANFNATKDYYSILNVQKTASA